MEVPVLPKEAGRIGTFSGSSLLTRQDWAYLQAPNDRLWIERSVNTPLPKPSTWAATNGTELLVHCFRLHQELSLVA